MSNWSITSNEDNSVTFESKSIKAVITGNTYNEAHNFAYVLANVIDMKVNIEESSRIVKQCLSELRSLNKDMYLLKYLDKHLIEAYSLFSIKK